MALQVHFSDEEFHPAPEICADHFFGPIWDAVIFLIEPGDQAVALFSRQDENVILADLIFRFDGDTEIFRRHFCFFHHRFRRRCGHHHHIASVALNVARVIVIILDQARRGVFIEMIYETRIGDIDLFAFRDVDDWNYHGELARFAAIIGRHRDHRALIIAHQHHFRGVIEQVCIGFGDIEAAKGRCARGAKRERGEAERARPGEVFQVHRVFPPSMSIGTGAQARAGRVLG